MPRNWRRLVPNLLSGLRIALAAVFPFLPVTARLPVIVVSLASEFFDGFLARRWNAMTRLGQLLDPIADKLFVLASVGVLIAENRLSWFHFSLVAMRDIVVTIGVGSVMIESREAALPLLMPRYSGKITTAMQFAFLLSLYALNAMPWSLFVLTALASCVSALDYLYVVLHRRFDLPSGQGGPLPAKTIGASRVR